jgi:uncharacterized protein YhfF
MKTRKNNVSSLFHVLSHANHWFGDLECLKEIAHALYVAQRLLEGEKYVTCSLVIAMIEEIRESFKATLANFNILQAPRGVKVLETVIVEINKRFGDGINVTEFREGPGRQPQGYTKVCSILV